MFRTRQKKMTAVVISFAVLFVFVSQAVAVGTWTRGNFEIHVFQVGQADSQLIIGPTGRPEKAAAEKSKSPHITNIQFRSQNV